MVLGIDFLKAHSVTLNVDKRQLSFKPSDESEIKFCLDTNNTVVDVFLQNVPLLSASNVKIQGGESTFISVKNSFDFEVKSDCYFEGNPSAKDLDGYSGILNVNSESQVFVRNCNEKKRITIREGDKIGTISTMVALETPMEDVDDYWSMKKLEENIELNHEDLDEEKKGKVYEMLFDVNLVLSKGDSDIGKIDVEPHHIELTDKTPIWQKPRIFAEPINEEIEKQCDELLSNDIIEHSESRWSSPCVPVRKPDGSLRLCIDYRGVNKKTKTDQFPMPNLQNCLYRAHNIKYFTKLDLVRGYYQVEIDEDSRQYTAFSTTRNQYQFKRLPFGLKNSGIAFQRIMQRILSPVSSSNIIVYIDDILIMSADFEEHLKLVGKVLRTLARYHIKIKVGKCEFFRSSVNFLGHKLSGRGIEKSRAYVDKVRQFSRPSTVTELRQFLGLVNFQRKFVPRCAEICKPLYDVTGQPKKATIIWTEERIQAFERIKLEIEQEVRLSYPDYGLNSHKLELFVDASANGAGACLMQQQDGEANIMGHASMAFSSTQKRYSTIERELTAIRWGIKAFKPFLSGVSFVLYTDHRPLIYMHNMAPHNSRIERTLLDLSEYDFEIRYQKGVDNEAADYLSRMDPPQRDLIVREGLPKDMRILQKIDGGGDAMFSALLEGMRYCLDEEVEIPEDMVEMRSVVVRELLRDPKKYGLLTNKQERNRLKLMLNPGQLPCAEALLATCHLFNVEIRVFHNIPTPVIYKVKENSSDPVINLQCISYIHYNPLFSSKGNIVNEDNHRYINLCHGDNAELVLENIESNSESIDSEMGNLFEEQKERSDCGHERGFPWIVTIYNGVKMCALIDTGAQVSVIDESVWNKIWDGTEIIYKPVPSQLHGMAHTTTPVIGTVFLQLHDNNGSVFQEAPFAIVKDSGIPSCLLLGLNFLSVCGAQLDFSQRVLTFNDKKDSVCLGHGSSVDGSIAWCGSLELDEDQVDVSRVKFVISPDRLKLMQTSNHAIKLLRHRINNGVPSYQWNNQCLSKFKRCSSSLVVEDDVLVRKWKNQSGIVVSFPFLVEVLFTVHKQLSHCGRHKLLDVVNRMFWHPAMDMVARDICSSCAYCQLYKTNLQQESPPTLKINSQHPFSLVAVDLIMFPKTVSGHVAALVLVDLCSRWLCSVPLKNKTSTAVSTALRGVFSTLPRVPDRLLSDNGSEFISSATETVLTEFGIHHSYSSPYHPSSNGAVERVNRTLKDLLMTSANSGIEWDVALPRAVSIYNQTFHSQLKCSPSEYILNKQHMLNGQFNVDQGTLSTWKEGHPNFAPFVLNQKVIKKINKGGHLTSHKFSPKYDGPYRIARIQSNKVSYEIHQEGNPEIVIKAHHSQLRAWKEVPGYIRKYLHENDNLCNGKVCPDKETSLLPGLNIPSSESSSFEGFDHVGFNNGGIPLVSQERLCLSDTPSSSSGFDDSSIVMTIDNCSERHLTSSKCGSDIKSINKCVNNNVNPKCVFSNKELSSFHCSEIITEGVRVASSTPVTNNQSISKYFESEQSEILNVLDQAVAVQEDIVERTQSLLEELALSVGSTGNLTNESLTPFSNDRELQVMNTSGVGNEVSVVNVPLPPNLNDVETSKMNEFLGFSSPHCTGKSACILNDMRNLIASSRKNIMLGRSRCQSLRKEIWDYRQSKSIISSTCSESVHSALNELDDQVSDLRPIVRTPRRILRSMGRVPDCPRVQPAVLEYGSRISKS